MNVKIVWVVWRIRHTDGRWLVAICADEVTAESEVDRQVEWLRSYHGPSYMPRFDQKLGARRITTQYGEAIEWEERLVKSEGQP